MDRYTEPTQSLPVTLPQMIKPLLRLNYLVGTFPYIISYGKHCGDYDSRRGVALSTRSFHHYRTMVTLALVSGSVLAILIRLFQSVVLGMNFSSNINNVGSVIELICTVHANAITLMILLLLFFKRKILERYLTEICGYAETLRIYIDNTTVYGTVRKLYFLYTCLALMTGVAVAVRYYLKPVNSPVAVWLEVMGLNAWVASSFPPEVLGLISAAFVFYLAMTKFVLLGNLEVVSCVQAVCFSRTMENIMEYMENQMEIWKRQYKGLQSRSIDMDDFLNFLVGATSISSPLMETLYQHPKKMDGNLHSDLEDYIDQIREFNPSLVSGTVPRSATSSAASSAYPDSTTKIPASFKTTPGRALGHAARKFLKVASMQNIANSVFGTTLAVNTGCIVVMNVILKYLVITSFMGYHKQNHQCAEGYQCHSDGRESTTGLPISLGNSSDSENSTMTLPSDMDDLGTNGTNAGSNDTTRFTLPPSSYWPAFQLTSQHVEWLMFIGVDTTMFIRLAVTIICLGRVHKTALQFNQVMGKAFLTANRIIDEIATTLANNAEGGVGDGITGARDNNGNAAVEQVTRLLMTPTQMSSIIAFMNLNNANPVAFTAGGLFVFSRGLLLMVISIIVSYLVFLLQAS